MRKGKEKGATYAPMTAKVPSGTRTGSMLGRGETKAGPTGPPLRGRNPDVLPDRKWEAEILAAYKAAHAKGLLENPAILKDFYDTARANNVELPSYTSQRMSQTIRNAEMEAASAQYPEMNPIERMYGGAMAPYDYTMANLTNRGSGQAGGGGTYQYESGIPFTEEALLEGGASAPGVGFTEGMGPGVAATTAATMLATAHPLVRVPATIGAGITAAFAQPSVQRIAMGPKWGPRYAAAQAQSVGGNPYGYLGGNVLGGVGGVPRNPIPPIQKGWGYLRAGPAGRAMWDPENVVAGKQAAQEVGAGFGLGAGIPAAASLARGENPDWIQSAIGGLAGVALNPTNMRLPFGYRGNLPEPTPFATPQTGEITPTFPGNIEGGATYSRPEAAEAFAGPGARTTTGYQDPNQPVQPLTHAEPATNLGMARTVPERQSDQGNMERTFASGVTRPVVRVDREGSTRGYQEPTPRERVIALPHDDIRVIKPDKSQYLITRGSKGWIVLHTPKDGSRSQVVPGTFADQDAAKAMADQHYNGLPREGIEMPARYQRTPAPAPTTGAKSTGVPTGTPSNTAVLPEAKGATQQVVQPEGSQPKRQSGTGSGQAPKAGSGDSTVSTAEVQAGGKTSTAVAEKAVATGGVSEDAYNSALATISKVTKVHHLRRTRDEQDALDSARETVAAYKAENKGKGKGAGPAPAKPDVPGQEMLAGTVPAGYNIVPREDGKGFNIERGTGDDAIDIAGPYTSEADARAAAWRLSGQKVPKTKPAATKTEAAKPAGDTSVPEGWNLWRSTDKDPAGGPEAKLSREYEGADGANVTEMVFPFGDGIWRRTKYINGTKIEEVTYDSRDAAIGVPKTSGKTAPTPSVGKKPVAEPAVEGEARTPRYIGGDQSVQNIGAIEGDTAVLKTPKGGWQPNKYINGKWVPLGTGEYSGNEGLDVAEGIAKKAAAVRTPAPPAAPKPAATTVAPTKGEIYSSPSDPKGPGVEVLSIRGGKVKYALRGTGIETTKTVEEFRNIYGNTPRPTKGAGPAPPATPKGEGAAPKPPPPDEVPTGTTLASEISKRGTKEDPKSLPSGKPVFMTPDGEVYSSSLPTHAQEVVAASGGNATTGSFTAENLTPAFKSGLMRVHNENGVVGISGDISKITDAQMRAIGQMANAGQRVTFGHYPDGVGTKIEQVANGFTEIRVLRDKVAGGRQAPTGTTPPSTTPPQGWKNHAGVLDRLISDGDRKILQSIHPNKDGMFSAFHGPERIGEFKTQQEAIAAADKAAAPALKTVQEVHGTTPPAKPKAPTGTAPDGSLPAVQAKLLALNKTIDAQKKLGTDKRDYTAMRKAMDDREAIYTPAIVDISAKVGAKGKGEELREIVDRLENTKTPEVQKELTDFLKANGIDPKAAHAVSKYVRQAAMDEDAFGAGAGTTDIFGAGYLTRLFGWDKREGSVSRILRTTPPGKFRDRVERDVNDFRNRFTAWSYIRNPTSQESLVTPGATPENPLSVRMGWLDRQGGPQGRTISRALTTREQAVNDRMMAGRERLQEVKRYVESYAAEQGIKGRKVKQVFDDFINWIEMDKKDPRRLNAPPQIKKALELYDGITEGLRKSHIDYMRNTLGQEVSDNWGLTEQGYFKHLFMKDFTINVKNADKYGLQRMNASENIHAAPADNYLEMLAMAKKLEADGVPLGDIEFRARSIPDVSSTVRTSPTRFFKMVNSTLKNLRDEKTGQFVIPADEVAADYRAMAQPAKDFQYATTKNIGSLMKRAMTATGEIKNPQGWLRDFDYVTNRMLQESVEGQEITKLRREINPILQEWKASGNKSQQVMADQVFSMLDRISHKPTDMEISLANAIGNIPAFGGATVAMRKDPMKVMRFMTTNMQAAAYTVAIRGRPAAALYNSQGPLITLGSRVPAKDFANAYWQYAKPATRERLRREGIMDGRIELVPDPNNEGAFIPKKVSGSNPLKVWNWFTDVSAMNRAIGYLYGENLAREAIKRGVKLTEAQVRQEGLTWAHVTEYRQTPYHSAPHTQTEFGKFATQFQGYTINNLEDWWQAANEVVKPVAQQNRGTATRHILKKAGTQIGLAGVRSFAPGFIGTGTYFYMQDYLDKHFGKKPMHEQLARMATHGLQSGNWMGIDATANLGVLPDFMQVHQGKEDEGIGPKIGRQLTPASWSMGEKVVAGVRKGLTKNTWGEFWEDVLNTTPLGKEVNAVISLATGRPIFFPRVGGEPGKLTSTPDKWRQAGGFTPFERQRQHAEANEKMNKNKPSATHLITGD